LAEYDPDILQKYADRLYSEARWLAVLYFFVGTVLSFFPICGLVLKLSRNATGQEAVLALCIALMVGTIAAGHGYSQSFHKRLEAQRTLCQLQIEKNTRQAQVLR
jgi:hypothetical protein